MRPTGLNLLSCLVPVLIVFGECTNSPRICPLPICRECPTAGSLRSPGIGFDLSTSYGTAAVRLHNGSFIDVCRIQGTAEYQSVMERFLKGPRDRRLPQRDSIWDELAYMLKMVQRRLNKAVGRAATPEIAILASLVAELRAQAELMLGHGIYSVIISSPYRVGLSYQEVTDITDYLGLRNLMIEDYSLNQDAAAYAGYGYGLCSNYTNSYACENEEYTIPMHRLLHLHFSEAILSATTNSLRSAGSGLIWNSFFDTGLGLGSKADFADEALYWDRVTQAISIMPEEFPWKIDVIVLTGESALEPRFLTAVSDAMRGFVDDATLTTLSYPPDALFAAAKGAAEFAKRNQEGPLRCFESDECLRKRESLTKTEL